MPTPKFCSLCGASLQAPATSLTASTAYCPRCAPRFRAWRVVKVASLVLLIGIAFGLGRYLSPQRTVYLIGTPIDPMAAVEPGAASATGAPSMTREARAVASSDEIVTICGAPTKSGKPCQRKVKGGGYCYQHRDKYGQKNAGMHSQ
jgi:hypothetical protein